MKNGIYFKGDNRGQCPSDESEALTISLHYGYTKEEIEEHFETSTHSLKINCGRWGFKWEN
jgi:hypothetical protein